MRLSAVLIAASVKQWILFDPDIRKHVPYSSILELHIMLNNRWYKFMSSLECKCVSLLH